MRALVLIAVLGLLGLAACGGDDSDGSSSQTATAPTTATTTEASSNPAAIDAACEQVLPATAKADAESVYDNVVPQTEKISAVADQQGEPAFAQSIREFGQRLGAIDQAARDPAPLEKATATAKADASEIGAASCVKYIDASRKATAG